MRKLIWWMVILLPVKLWAQSGIQFTKELSWQQVKEKAKEENKYIFVDCFATWCGPCKQMDREVYPDNNVGEFVNTHFVSVKVQFDSTKNDDPEVRAWYPDVKSIMKDYRIAAFPTYLFFSPDGKLIHRGEAYQKPVDFLSLTKDALDPDKQLYQQLETFRQGKMTYPAMPLLVMQLKKANDNKAAREVANNYIDNYLHKLPEDSIFKKETIQLMQFAVQSSSSRAFNLFYKQADRIDRVMQQKGFAQNAVLDSIIGHEEIDMKLWKDFITYEPLTKNPDWTNIYNTIEKKYTKDDADRNVINGKIRWYAYSKEWAPLINNQVKKIEKYGLDTAGLGWIMINNLIFNTILPHSNDRVILHKALQWMKIIDLHHPNDPPDMDTESNLLYKLGRRKEAIALEKRAVAIDAGQAKINKSKPDKSLQETLDKMKAGTLTWE